jgi:hypothetical protein
LCGGRRFGEGTIFLRNPYPARARNRRQEARRRQPPWPARSPSSDEKFAPGG